MSLITIQTSKVLTLCQEKAIVQTLEKYISLFPNHNSDDLMIHIEEDQVMYYQGQDVECLKINCFVDCDDVNVFQEFTKKCQNAIKDITNIPISHQKFLIYYDGIWKC